MKYLKQFENHNQYYTKIDVNEFELKVLNDSMDILGPDVVPPFTHREIKYLRKIHEEVGNESIFREFKRRQLSDTRIKEWEEMGCDDDIVMIKFGIDKEEFTESSKLLSSLPTVITIDLNIYKYKDEWFYIEAFGSGHYECDQLEGVKKLIMDLI